MDGVQEYRKDEWQENILVERFGILGVEYRQLYSLRWDCDPATLGWITGAEYPGHSAARIIGIYRRGKIGTSRKIVELVGFEPLEWSE